MPDSRPVRPRLTLGMPCFDDFDGVYFTVQALRFYHADILETCEIVVIDNHPESAAGEAVKQFITNQVPNGRYVPYTDCVGPAAAKDRVFREAAGEFVVCMDSHVFLMPGALTRLAAYYDAHPECHDLLQGPLLADRGNPLATHMDPNWRTGMFGTWAMDERGEDPEGDPFEIPMHGCALMSCRKEAWLGFHPEFRHFGGEEGYIHEKFRKHGRKTLCLPFLRWLHRFGRPGGVPYPAPPDARVRNYLVGRVEMGQPVDDILDHFEPMVERPMIERVLVEVGLPPLEQLALARQYAELIQSESAKVPATPRTPQESSSLPWPRVSCLMPTYNRLPAGQAVVEEAVASFLKQDYPNKELVILNDCPGQTIQFEYPQVVVVNVNKRFRTLGEKHNAMAALTSGDLICPWDDDDIHLPWRISTSVAHLGNRHYWTARGYWLWDETLRYDHSFGFSHNQSIYTREMFDRIKGYPHSPYSQDQDILPDFRDQGVTTAGEPLHTCNWYYIYRWTTSSYHGSGYGENGYDKVGEMEIEPGNFRLNPHWRVDYAMLVKGILTDAYEKGLLSAPARNDPPSGHPCRQATVR